MDDDFFRELDRARKQLFQARLEYTKPEKLGLTVGHAVYFRAAIYGRWSHVDKRAAGMSVVTGGQVVVRLHCSGAVTCTPISSKRQHVTNKLTDQAATWVWEVQAKKSGKANLALTVTSYFEDTETVLYEKPPIISHAEVKEKPQEEGGSAWLADAYDWATKMIEELALIATALAAILGLAVAWRNRNLPAPTVQHSPLALPPGAAQQHQPTQPQHDSSTPGQGGPTSGSSTTGGNSTTV
ncbi:hypothetical protein [Streptomyces violaceus]|uniref:VASt domain-containing protein n=1 Tax=Streptomyces violaceus TaxID=1936 RepID=A0ABY9UEC3_STRVL|nr:hypothetical protein [Streptomyces janthinus]WND21065.1 hypothetical protein RI060_28660 [Streptomyces janthinus]GGS48441.1 hypothetical protein GCM10010270_18300 [Streptomyces janthinus]